MQEAQEKETSKSKHPRAGCRGCVVKQPETQWLGSATISPCPWVLLVRTWDQAQKRQLASTSPSVSGPPARKT